MRPRPSEIIAGMRAILAETIAPELTSEHARARLAEIRAVLAQIDWDNVGFDVMSRTEVLARALREARGFAEVELPDVPTEKNADSYQRYQEQLSGAATSALAALRAHLVAQPADAEAHAAYRAILAAL